MRFHYHFALAASAIMGCATVSVDGVRKANDPGTIQPVAFIIFQSDTPPSYSQILHTALAGEMQRRGIAAHFTIVSGSGNKGGVAAKALSDVPGCVMLAPSDGSPRLNGVVAPAYYDVRAFRILKHPGPAEPGSGPNGTTPINDGKGLVTTIWRGRAYARGGFAEEKLGAVASQLVVRLIADDVLPGNPQPLPPETTRAAPVGGN
jgi:hypothetical protein